MAIAVVSGVVAIVWSYLPAGDILERLELKTIDARFIARGPRATSGKVAIVEVDDRSLGALGPWPWPRERFVKLIRHLESAGARAIAFDILFAETDNVNGQKSDAAFVASVREFGRVFQAAATLLSAHRITQQQARASGALERFALKEARVEPGSGFDVAAQLHRVRNAIGPFPALAQATRGTGFVDVVASRDGVYRHYLPVVERRGKLCPSLALALATHALAAPARQLVIRKGRSISLGGKRRIAIDRAGAALIDFAGPDHTFPYYSAANVIETPEDLPAGAFKDKIVLVAVTATGLYDLRASPYGAVFNGVETQANALDNILGGRELRRQKPESVLLYTLCWALVIGFFMSRFTAETYVPLGIGLIVCHNVIAMWHFNTRGVATAMVIPSLGMALALISVAGYQLITQERRQRTLHNVLSRFVPPEIARRLAEEDTGPVITGERRTVTVLFADLRGFTSASARMPPEDIVALLNRYFRLMHEVIFEFGGTLDKFMGDELMAFFNAPVEQIDHAHLAVATAMEMQHRIETCREEWAFYGMPDLAATVGISTGEVVVGYVGSGDRMQYTVMGADVNIASRLEGLGKELDVRIIISEATHQLVRDMVKCRDLGTFSLHGVAGETRAYEVRGMLGRL